MGKGELKITTQTLKVLGAIVSCPHDEFSGAEIARVTKLASGTLYPILLRLEQARWLVSRWEAGDPHVLGRPRRRLYRISASGARNAQASFREVESAIGGLAWN